MCLRTSQIIPRFAWKDIVVYKNCEIYLKYEGDEFNPTVIELKAAVRRGHVYNKKERSGLGVKVVQNSLFNYRANIEEGLHANINNKFRNNTEWIIPRGSCYYKSESEIVSTRLNFSRLLPYNHSNLNGEAGEYLYILDPDHHGYWGKWSHEKHFIIQWKDNTTTLTEC